ncbi:DEAD/DEAH box helicase [Sorangium sp. So ce216]
MSRYQLDAYAANERALAEMTSFVRSSFRFRDPTLDDAVHKAITDFGLVAPPVVEANFPFELPSLGPKTTGELAKAGIVHRDLPALLQAARGEAQWPADRPLYLHQVEAIENYRKVKSLVVASGTGSGKTECFLFPALDKLLRDPDLKRPGVRVLLLYPLNALVNNQMDRLRAICGDHPTIRFSLYTSRLPETTKEAERKLKKLGLPVPRAELISREQLRERPPHILVTNYSMLEYALVRPADAPIFSDRFARPEMVVIDEAHVYAGAMAAELTLLMRRAWLRWGIAEPSAVQGIATSATMHQGISDGRERLRSFAASLLSKAPSDVEPIEGRRVVPQAKTSPVKMALPAPAAVAALDTDFATLVDEVVDGDVEVKLDGSKVSRERAQQVVDVLRPGFRTRDDLPAARLLHDALEPLTWVRKLRGDLNDAPTRIDRLADALFGKDGDLGVRRQAAHRVLEVLALARSAASEIPLLPVRIHATARGPHGVYACLNGQCPEAVIRGALGTLYTEPVGRCGCGCGVYELRVCESCGQSFVLGLEGAGDDGLPALVPQRVHGQAGSGGGKRKEDKSDVALFCFMDRWDDGSPFPTADGAPEQRWVDTSSAPCRLGAADGRRLWRFLGGNFKGPERTLAGVACPRCDSQRPALPVIRRVQVGTDAALQVLIDGVYPSLPRHRAAAGRWLRGEGRRLLLFADNRQVAASLAAKVEESHDTLLARRILVEALDACAGRGESGRASALQREIVAAVERDDFEEAARLKVKLAAARAAAAAEGVDFECLASAIRDHADLRELSNHDAASALDLARMLVARELSRRPGRLGNLEANGVVVVDYGIAFPAPKHPGVRRLFPDDVWSALVATLLDTMRADGACTVLRVGIHDDFLPRRLIDRPMVKEHPKGKAGADTNDDAADGAWEKTPVPLMPSGAGVTANENRRLAYVARVLAELGAPAAVTPVLILEEVWDALDRVAPVGQQQSQSVSPIRRRNEAGRLEIVFHLLRFRRSSAGPLCRCRLCRTSWARAVADVCPTSHCEGTLARIPPGQELDDRDRIVARAVGEGRTELLGLNSEEHTAQILPEDLEQSEARFKEGERNALVCSTTMELGVDIGGLSATFLTNVPPGPSNYLQRAGRAGRRAEGTALVLTFARPRPFDQAAFADPERPFKLPITPPAVKLDSPRICRRHVYAHLLARFFQHFDAGVSAQNPLTVFGSVKAFFEDAVAAVEHLDAAVGDRIGKTLGVDVKQETMCHAFVAWLVDMAVADTALVAQVRALTARTALASMSMDDIADRCWTHIEKIAAEVRHQLRVLNMQLDAERAKPEAAQDRGMIRALEYQLYDLASESLLSYLAVAQFLPRYGFPVQVVPLVERWEESRGESRSSSQPRLRLERDVALALSEYAPGAEVIAGKHVHVSRGLLRHWTGTDAPGVIAQRVIGLCPNCGQFHFARNQGGLEKACKTCKQPGLREIPVIQPKLGFAVQWGRRPQRWAGGARTALRPVTEAVYATREGGPTAEVSAGLALAYDEEGSILVRTEGSLVESDRSGASASSAAVGAQRQGYGYAICYLCGRAEPETELPGTDKKGNKVDPLPKALEQHQRLRGKGRCENKGNYWRHMVLAGDLRTETLRIELKGALALPGGEDGLRLATTWMVALQLAAGEVLGVDSREVSGLLSPRGVGQGFVYDVILYDQVAGGVGHCRALRERWQDLVIAARQRLQCSNPACTTACHRCLLAFETQRYEPLLRRRKLLDRLDPGWALLEKRAERDGLPVEPVFRGGVEVRERLARLPTVEITVVAPSVGRQAMADDGWLRWIVRHADGPGRARVVLGRLPDPNSDEERITALRLRLAIEMGKVEVRKVSPSAAADFAWKLSSGAPDSEDVFLVEQAHDVDALGPGWLRENCRVFRTVGRAAGQAARERVAALVAAARVCTASDFEPDEAAPSIIVHSVPARKQGADATFARWFVNASGEALNHRPIRALRIVDPYLQTEWQLTLLEEAAAFFRARSCQSLEVETYAPHPEKENQGHGRHRTLSAVKQKARIACVAGNPEWRPLVLPSDPLARVHQRAITGTREDGSRFVVLLERGLDFIAFDMRQGARVTRESYVVVKEE